MMNPTHDDQNDRPRLRLELDSGELLEIDGASVGGLAETPAVVLRLTPCRAHDLAHVLDTYTRLVEVMSRWNEVSGTEASLSRGLYDAAELLGSASRKPLPKLTEEYAEVRCTPAGALEREDACGVNGVDNLANVKGGGRTGRNVGREEYYNIVSSADDCAGAIAVDGRALYRAAGGQR